MAGVEGVEVNVVGVVVGVVDDSREEYTVFLHMLAGFWIRLSAKKMDPGLCTWNK